MTTQEDKLHEEHVKRARLLKENEYYTSLTRLLNMQIEYMKEHMNYSEKLNG